MSPDPRFYDRGEPLGLEALARLVGARLLDEGRGTQSIHGVAVLGDGDGGCVTFWTGQGDGESLAVTRSGACFLAEDMAARVPKGCAALATPWPQAAYAIAASRFHPVRRHDGERRVDPSAVLEGDVRLGPGATIAQGAHIGRGARIGAGASIGPGVMIGRDVSIGPGARVGFALIGDRVNILAGAVIGEAGFGAAAGPKGIVDLPQLGRVILQDGVTIGANSCVDRGAWDDTVIGENTKIDNLVQIAHNVVVGRNCVMAAHTGVSGSVTIGDGCQLGGRVGIADHLTIGAGARLAAAAGVMRNVPAGQTWGGYPARPMATWMRQTAWLSRAARVRTSKEDDQ